MSALHDPEVLAQMALLTGASLVPVISFGENETFSQYKGGLARKVILLPRCCQRLSSLVNRFNNFSW